MKRKIQQSKRKRTNRALARQKQFIFKMQVKASKFKWD